MCTIIGVTLVTASASIIARRTEELVSPLEISATATAAAAPPSVKAAPAASPPVRGSLVILVISKTSLWF